MPSLQERTHRGGGEEPGTPDKVLGCRGDAKEICQQFLHLSLESTFKTFRMFGFGSFKELLTSRKLEQRVCRAPVSFLSVQ